MLPTQTSHPTAVSSALQTWRIRSSQVAETLNECSDRHALDRIEID